MVIKNEERNKTIIGSKLNKRHYNGQYKWNVIRTEIHFCTHIKIICHYFFKL